LKNANKHTNSIQLALLQWPNTTTTTYLAPIFCLIQAVLEPCLYLRKYSSAGYYVTGT